MTRLQCRPDEYTAQLSAALKKNKYLKQLRLEGNGLGDRDCAVLAEGIAANSCLQVLDLQKNRISNDGGSALANGIAKNTSLIEINLMNQPARWGDGCLDAFLAMFDSNVTLLKITWRLESRKSFALNKMITRNNEIDRRKKCGMAYHDLLPAALKGFDEGKENVPAHSSDKHANPVLLATSDDSKSRPEASSPSAAKPLQVVSPERAASGGENLGPAHPSRETRDTATTSSATGTGSSCSNITEIAGNITAHNNGQSTREQPTSPAGIGPRPVSQRTPGSSVLTPASGRSGLPAWAGMGGSTAGNAGAAEGTPKPGVPRVRRAMPSVLARWPPAAQPESD